MTPCISVQILTQLYSKTVKEQLITVSYILHSKAGKIPIISRYFFRYMRIKKEPWQKTCLSLRTWIRTVNNIILYYAVIPMEMKIIK